MQHIQKRLFVLCITVITMFTSAGNSFADTTEEAQQSQFVMGMSDNNIEWNPLLSYSATEAQLYTAIYEGLVAYNPFSLRPEAAVADRWEISEDGLTYRFHIRESARYSNGDKVLASHFRNAWLFMLDPETDSPFAFLLDPIEGAAAYRRGEISDSNLVGIRVPDESTIELQLSNRTSYLLSVLAHQSLVAIHPDMLSAMERSDVSGIIGNGPYSASEVDDNHISFERNEFYWDKDNSTYAQIAIQFNDDAADATSRFNSGEVQWLYSGFQYQSIRIPNSIQISSQFATSYYFLNANQAPYDDPRIRKALLLLLPLDEIRSTSVYYLPSAKLIPQIPGYPEVSGISEQNTQQALELLNDAGYPNGAGLPELKIVLSDSSDSRRVAQLMAQSWTQALDVQVSQEFPSYRTMMEIQDNGAFSVSSVSWIADYADPMSFLQLWTSDSPLNNAGYDDQHFDSLLEESNRLSGTTRFEKLGEAEEYLLQSGIVLPISHSPSFNVINLEAVGGWFPNPLDIHPFKYLFQMKLTPPANIAQSGDSESSSGL